jgi:hypothetical protein
VGVIETGFAAQFSGKGVVPAVQLRFTLLLYPFSAEIVPLNVALCAAKIVRGLLLKLIWKSGVVIRFHSQMPRP